MAQESEQRGRGSLLGGFLGGGGVSIAVCTVLAGFIWDAVQSRFKTIDNINGDQHTRIQELEKSVYELTTGQEAAFSTLQTREAQVREVMVKVEALDLISREIIMRAIGIRAAKGAMKVTKRIKKEVKVVEELQERPASVEVITEQVTPPNMVQQQMSPEVLRYRAKQIGKNSSSRK